MIDVPYVVITSIAIFLVVVPLPWHVTAWNSATCYMMLWTTIGCIIHLTNSVVWYHNLENPSPIYCDISTKLSMGLSIAIPLSSLCINRRLYNIAAMSTVAVTRNQKKRDVLIDTLLAVLGPIIFMAVHYTMQGHRYDIIENYGCWPATYLTAPAYVLVIAPPAFVCSISLVYASLSLRAFIRRRTEFNQLLKKSSTGLNPGRYFRLMALASAEVLIGLPTALYFLITDLKTAGVAPWISWEDTHLNFSHINYFPTYFFKFNRATQVAIEMNRWTFPFIALLFFAFFGLGDEARKNYRRAYYTVLKPFGVVPPPSLGSTGTSQSNDKYCTKSKAMSESFASPDALVSPPPRYSSPRKPTPSSWSLSTFDLSPPLDSPTYEVVTPTTADSQVTVVTPLPASDAHDDHDYSRTSTPHSTLRSPSRPVLPPLNVHIMTTTETSTERLV